MRRSFLRLVITSVLGCWILGFAVLFIYARSLIWTEDKARRDGVFLAHELLAAVPASERQVRLRDLEANFHVPFSLMPRVEVERRLGRAPGPDETIAHEIDGRSAWYFLGFGEGEGVLAAGPVDPKQPPGVLPIGVLFTVFGLPLVAGLIAIRIERGLAPVEKASEALAVGELSARVVGAQGPSTELAASFNAMAERVERLVKSRDELVQAVSHELGSPLSRLRFHLELLGGASEQSPERVAAMNRELDALDALVAELLGYVQSYDEAGLDRQSFDPSPVLTDLAELARLDAPRERPVEVQVDLPSGVEVSADPRQFQRAIENILRNAVRHAAARVRLELVAVDAEVRVTVHDDGPGIPEEMRDKVLVPFFRLDSDRARETGGVGLGLAITHRILERHRGGLSIGRSDLGGASVQTRWPTSG